MTKRFRAPWSVLLKVISGLLTAMWVWTLALLVTGFSPQMLLLCGVFTLLVVPAALFTIRGYTVTEDALLIKRLCWSTRLPLAGLQAVEVLPRAMRRSVRTCGNGGAFSITGCFWSQPLGAYRAFVTDSKRTVVLKFSPPPLRIAGSTIVVSPDLPEDFARALSPHVHGS